MNYLIIGMGRFGRSIAKTLYENNKTVLAIDSDENLIQEAINENVIYDGVSMDAKDEIALRKMVEGSFETAFVCIGTKIQDSILITLNLKEMGIPNIICKATSKIHGKVLERVGATKVIYPEEEMGEKVANAILNPTVFEYFNFSDEYSIVEMKVPDKLAGQMLMDLDLRKKYGANIIAIRDIDDKLNVSPMPDTVLEKNQCLVIFGDNSKMKQLLNM